MHCFILPIWVISGPLVVDHLQTFSKKNVILHLGSSYDEIRKRWFAVGRNPIPSCVRLMEEILLTSWYGKYPIIYRVSLFHTSQVVQDFFHQQCGLGCPLSQWQMKMFRDPSSKCGKILVVTTSTGKGAQPNIWRIFNCFSDFIRACYMSPLNITKKKKLLLPSFSFPWRWYLKPLSKGNKNSKNPVHTVDGSEIPFPTTWDI